MTKNKNYVNDEFRRYWAKRSEKALWKDLKDADDLVDELKKYYDEAHGNIQSAIDALYGKYADENGIPKEKALEIIKGKEYRRWRMSMEEYLKAIDEDQALALELNTLCMRKRINRLEAIEGEITANMAMLASVQCDKIGDHLVKCLNRNYYGSMYGFYKNKDPSVLALMKKHGVAIDQRAVQVMLTMPWSGANYSSRIWKREYNIAKRIKEKVVQNILIGTNLDKLSKELAGDLKLDSDKNVRRLLFTETAYVKGQADLLLYKKLGIDEYEILATLDKRTSSICRKMDGKHYPLNEAVEGETYPPFHPNCRTTTIAYRENKEGKTRTARNVNGKSYDVPLDMTYDAWHKRYVDGIKSRDYNKSEQRPNNKEEPPETVLKSFKQLSNDFISKYDIMIDEEIQGMDRHAINESCYAIERFIREFPEIATTVDYVGLNRGDGVMSSDGRSIFFNPDWYNDYDRLVKLCQSQSESGYWVKDSNIMSNAIHECAHGLEWWLAFNNTNDRHGKQRYQSFLEGEESRKVIAVAMSKLEGLDREDPSQVSDVISKISRYASESGSSSEVFAEAFVDVFLHGDKAEEISQKIKEETKRRVNLYKEG